MENEMRITKPVEEEVKQEIKEQIKEKTQNKPKRYFGIKIKRRYILIICTIIVVLLAIGAAGYFFMKVQKLQMESRNQAGELSEVQRVVSEVDKLLVLPQGEEPTVATISDVEKLRTQPFFQNAKNGYKVLIYAQAKKAILYDPVAKKIVEVAPLNINQTR